jgi:predicted nucleic acid-binding protein
MSQGVIADTGPLYAAVDPDDQYHRRAQRELKRLVKDRHDLVIAYPTLLESYTLLLYRLAGR